MKKTRKELKTCIARFVKMFDCQKSTALFS